MSEDQGRQLSRVRAAWRLSLDAEEIGPVAWSHDGAALAIGLGTALEIRWPEAPEKVMRQAHGHEITALAFGANDVVLVGFANGGARAWMGASPVAEVHFGAPITCIAGGPGRDFLVATAKGLKRWALGSHQWEELEETRALVGVEYSPSGKSFASWDDEGTCHVLQADWMHGRRLQRTTGPLSSVTWFSEDRLLVCPVEGPVNEYSAGGDYLRSHELQPDGTRVASTMDPQHELIAYRMKHRELVLADLRTDSVIWIQPWEAHGASESLAFRPGGWTQLLRVDRDDQGLHLRQFDFESPETRGAEAPGPTPEDAFAQGAKLRREAGDDERGLRVTDYADVLAHVLAHAEGEVCFALYGHWGRGKTFLMRRLEDILPESVPDLRYRTVWFSAWRYRSPPEVWAHLYEAFADAAGKPTWWTGLARTVRANWHRLGSWPLVGMALATGLAILPLSEKLSLVRPVISALGFFGAAWLVLAYRRVQAVMSDVWSRYFQLQRHEDKLGLQAAIGRDLRSLLSGWMPDNDAPVRQSALLTTLSTVVLATAVELSLLQFDSGAWIAGLCFASILACGTALASWSWKGGRETKRLLLIVDDLDRCPPDQVLDVIESIKLLLEEREVSTRVQAVMLVEERAVETALREKYEHFVRDVSEADREPHLRTIVRENVEKIFLAHLRLPPLAREELEELYDLYVAQSVRRSRERRRSAEQVLEGSAPEKRAPEKRDGRPPDPAPEAAAKESQEQQQPLQAAARDWSEAAETIQQSQRDGTVRPAEAPPLSDFTATEEEALRAGFDELAQGIGEVRLGPRSLRAYIFRYQLARLLLAREETSVSPHDLAVGLARALLRQDREATDTALDRVLAQVS